MKILRRPSRDSRTRASSVKKASSYYRSTPSRTPSPRSPFERSQNRPRTRLVVIAIDILVLLVLVFCLIYVLSLKPSPQVYVNNNSYRPVSVYRQAAAAELQSLKNRNKVSFAEGQVVASLKRQFPEIANATVQLPILGQRPVIRLNVAGPSFFLETGGDIYIINTQGKVVAKRIDLPKITNLPSVSDQSGFKPASGSQILGSNAVHFINDLIIQCKKSQIPITSLSLPAIAQELDLRTADRTYFVKFYLSGEASQQIGQFLAARQQFDLQNSQPSEYLDVRVAGKIFYK